MDMGYADLGGGPPPPAMVGMAGMPAALAILGLRYIQPSSKSSTARLSMRSTPSRRYSVREMDRAIGACCPARGTSGKTLGRRTMKNLRQ
jgi:hypothetical protein